jgi:deazaflavin-dependent oxidoreductase (nitroreductase family)
LNRKKEREDMIKSVYERMDTFVSTTYHVTFADRMTAALTRMLLRAGVKLGKMSLLTVRGRKSGQPHTVLVLPVEHDGERFLVAPYGVVQWVRNLRAAGTATLTRGRCSETFTVRELEAREAAPVLKLYLLLPVSAGVRSYFDVTKDSPLEAFEREAVRHPVFQITSVEETW